MDLRRIELLQESFALLSAAPIETALVFYARLFTLDPSLRPLFTRELREQSDKFMHMLAYIVGGLHRPVTVISEVKHLGERHVGYGVLTSHYAVVGEALLWAIEQRLGAQFTPEVRAAWHEAYFLIAGLMKEAAASATTDY